MREEGFDSEILNSHLERNYLMKLRGEGESVRREDPFFKWFCVIGCMMYM